MKNTIVGVVVAFVIPRIPNDFYFIASAVMVGALAALILMMVVNTMSRRASLEAELEITKQQLAWSEERRQGASKPRKPVQRRTARKPSMRKGGAA